MTSKRALVVGVDNYRSFPMLRKAVYDASETASILTMQEYAFEVVSLLDQKATVKQMQSEMHSLLASDAKLKLLYFAGHGLSNDAGVYLCAHDATAEEPGVNVVSLREQIRTTKGSLLIILDCCHAGAANVRDVAEIRCMNEGDLDRVLGDLEEGKILIAACGENEVAGELESLNHGIFTYYLLEGLLGSAANKQGIITPMGLFDYVAERMKKEFDLSPILKGEQRGQIVLGSGFAPSVLMPSQEFAITDGLKIEIENEAKRLLSDYFSQTKLPYEEWKTRGYKKACQLLEPILRWFNRQISEYPGITSSAVFDSAYREARTWLSQLGAIDIGYHVDEGTLVEYLGSGAFGAVYKVEKNDEKPLAYKIFHSSELHVIEKVSRFHRGYRAMNQLNHPHIVKVHKYTSCPIGFYMDYIAGPNLRNWIGTLSEPEQILSMLIKVAETLKHAHGRNVIHRDVKPENIIMEYSGTSWEPYLTDFDLAWFSTATQVTKEAFGVIFYAAPEQLSKPQSKVAHAPTTDVYSFGQLCYFMATGSNPVPFHGANNSRSLRERIGDWRTVESAVKFLELYENCTKDDLDERPNDFRNIIDVLHKCYGLSVKTSLDGIITEDEFARELSYQIAGLPETLAAHDKFFNSLSGRTNIEILDVNKDAYNQYTVRVKCALQAVMMPGMTHHQARQTLNARLEKALAGFKSISRRSGMEGFYNTTITAYGVEPTLAGVEKCRQIISRVIDIIEAL